MPFPGNAGQNLTLTWSIGRIRSVRWSIGVSETTGACSYNNEAVNL
jgi:hypothetical protein